MKTLREFLEERAEIERGRADEKMEMQQEWISAVHRLIEQIKEWISDADPNHFLESQRTYHRLREDKVGVYTAPGLVIRYEAREVQVVPIARMVVGPHLSNGLVSIKRAFGRVDITDGGEKYLLFRSQKDPVDEWAIVKDDGFIVKRFDRRTFEEAMQDLLQ
jgi:hypothetical protein